MARADERAARFFDHGVVGTRHGAAGSGHNIYRGLLPTRQVWLIDTCPSVGAGHENGIRNGCESLHEMMAVSFSAYATARSSEIALPADQAAAYCRSPRAWRKACRTGSTSALSRRERGKPIAPRWVVTAP